MLVTLTVTAGPHAGREFRLEGHDTFLVGRMPDCHFQLSYDDPYFSRRHFLVESNPPRCRVSDLGSRNGTYVNCKRITTTELQTGDEIRAGHTILKVEIAQASAEADTCSLPVAVPGTRTITGPQNVPSTAADSPSGVPEIPGLRIESEIGRGGMGVVYRATREFTGETVAVKLIVPSPGVSLKQVAKFLREARILSELNHPNIVQFHESGEAGGVLYFVMELAPGQDTSRVLRQTGPMGIKAAVRVMIPVLQALGHAHALGFVHRDVKPRNILMGQDRTGKLIVKLADFGLARVYQASQLSGLTLTGDIGGTPGYLPPEQITNFREVKPTADQYSAAATLYHLLTGQFIFDLPPGHAAFRMILEENPVPIQTRRPEVPDGLAAAIHRALAKEPGKRFLGVEDFAGELTQFQGE
jgi:serine/threonine-protein kinase